MRKLSSSQPVSVTTQVSGLVATLVIEESSPLRQWFSYDSGAYSPNRKVTPLIINAHVELKDNGNDEVSIASLVGNSESGTRWQIRTTVGTGTPSEWTNVGTTPPSGTEDKIWWTKTDTVCTLNVKQNVEPDTRIELKCIVEYSHPQMAGYTYKMEQVLQLCTDEDSDIVNPKLWLNAPSTWIYDVLLDDNTPGSDKYHIRTVSAYAEKEYQDVTSGVYFYWYIIENGIEYPVGASGNHPCYVSGGLNGASSVVVDAMYSESFTVKCRAKDRKSTAEEQAAAPFYEDILGTDIVWQPLNITKQCVCKNGAMIQVGEFPYKEFVVDVARKNKPIPRDVVEKNLLFSWKKRTETNSAQKTNETHLGWGPDICVPESAITNNNSQAKQSINVFADVYLRGAYANVVRSRIVDNETVKDNIVCTISGTTYNIISRS